MLHVKLLVERQRHILYVKVEMYNYCFIRVTVVHVHVDMCHGLCQ